MSLEELANALENIENIKDVEKLVNAQRPDRQSTKVKTTTRSILAPEQTRILIVNEQNTRDNDLITRLSATYPAFGKIIKNTAPKKTLKLTIRENIIEIEGG